MPWSRPRHVDLVGRRPTGTRHCRVATRRRSCRRSRRAPVPGNRRPPPGQTVCLRGHALRRRVPGACRRGRRQEVDESRRFDLARGVDPSLSWWLLLGACADVRCVDRHCCPAPPAAPELGRAGSTSGGEGGHCWCSRCPSGRCRRVIGFGTPWPSRGGFSSTGATGCRQLAGAGGRRLVHRPTPTGRARRWLLSSSRGSMTRKRLCTRCRPASPMTGRHCPDRVGEGDGSRGGELRCPAHRHREQ